MVGRRTFLAVATGGFLASARDWLIIICSSSAMNFLNAFQSPTLLVGSSGLISRRVIAFMAIPRKLGSRSWG